MANEYIAEKTYQVYIIVDSQNSSFSKTYALEDTHKSFPTYDEAEQWIQEEGDRQVNYTIINVIRKR
jgi:hypothetical protein